ncbi:MAG: hypothetical protein P4K83_00060 [Terracidiphilus sp.]|nr:hypothetical protein [Terracidiphilus sp.]
MHTHGTPFTVEAASFYSAQMERQAVARRAQETRKRLQRAASPPDEDASPEEALLIGQWLGSTTAEVIRSAPMLAGDEYHPSHPDDKA